MSSSGNDKLPSITLPLVSVCTTTYQHKDFIKQCLEGVLNQNGCEGIRVYFAEDDKKVISLVIVGTVKENNSLSVESTGTIHPAISQQEAIIDEGYPCPTWCPSNAL